MTSATLFREGTDLEALLAELDSEHPGQVHVLEVNHLREGGVFGFFARPRVAVHYTLDDDAAPTGRAGAAWDAPASAERGSDPLAALITAAEMVETGQPPAPTADAFMGETRDASNVEFARMLLDLAAKKAAERGVQLPARTGVTARPATSHASTALLERPGPGTRTLRPTRTPARTPANLGTNVGSDPATKIATTPAARADSAPHARPPAATTAPAVPAPAGGPDSAAAAAGEPLGFRVTSPARVTVPAAAAGSRPAHGATGSAGSAGPRQPAGPAEHHDGDERLTLRRRLAELGAPIARIPADSAHRYAAVEHLVNQLPEPPALPDAPDAVVAVAAPAPVLSRLIPLLAHRLGLGADHIWTFRAARGSTRDDRRLIEVGDARALAAALRRPRPVAVTPTLVAIGLDEDLDFPVGDETGEAGVPGASAAEMIEALAPDAFWLHVDATRKASDTAAAMHRLGTPTALIVTGAARTTSPASVWQLDVPIALLDGRPATRSAWAVLLLEKLAETER